MNSLFFWIIVLSFVVPAARRLYRNSVRRRNQDQGMPRRVSRASFRAGTRASIPATEQAAAGWLHPAGLLRRRFRQAGGPGRPVPPDPQYPDAATRASRTPAGSTRASRATAPPSRPYEDSPGYLNNPPVSGQPAAGQPPAPAVPPPPSGPQGYRARKLAELDQRYSNGELAMEDYMAQRAEIMKG